MAVPDTSRHGNRWFVLPSVGVSRNAKDQRQAKFLPLLIDPLPQTKWFESWCGLVHGLLDGRTMPLDARCCPWVVVPT
ncbi:hypothetical protein MLPF_2988 [Mycobacterium lepromatosis]|nr:hypothetical protein MLPF_2988 [Mycobacterium lepromatosis]